MALVFEILGSGQTMLQIFLSTLLDWRYYTLLTLISIVYYYVCWHTSSLPAGPTPLPVLGNLLQIGQEPHYGLHRLSAKYGDIFTVYIGSSPHLVLCSLQAIREVLVKHGDKTAGRPPVFGSILLKERLKKGLFAADATTWTVHRRFALKVLRDLGMGKNCMQERILDESEHLVAELSKSEGEAIDPFDNLLLALSDIVFSMCLGQRFEYNDEDYLWLLKNLDDGIQLIYQSRILVAMPWLINIPGDWFKIKEFQRTVHGGTSWTQKKIDRFRQLVEEGDQADSYIGAYLDEQRKTGDCSFTDEQLVASLLDVLAAGSETGASTLYWAIFYLCLHPDVQQGVHKEIDDVVGRSRQPNMSDRLKMPFTEACLTEIQRLGSVVPLAVPHRVTESFELRGHLIPEETVIIPLTWALDRDESIWQDVEKFDPYRHLTFEGKFVKSEYCMPFSAGSRSCLGESLAKMELFLFFTRLLQTFTFSLPHGATPPSTDGDFKITRKPPRYKVVCNMRD